MRINLATRDVRLFPFAGTRGFQTQRLLVKPFKLGDAEAMGDDFEQPEVWRFSQGIDSVAAATQWLNFCMEDPWHDPFTLWHLNGEELVGFLVFIKHGCQAPELGGWISPSLWGGGLGQELLEGACEFARNAGVLALTADVENANEAAGAVLKSQGFVHCDGLWNRVL